MVRGVPVAHAAQLYLHLVHGIETRVMHHRWTKIQLFGDLHHLQPCLVKMFEYTRGGLTSRAAKAWHLWQGPAIQQLRQHSPENRERHSRSCGDTWSFCMCCHGCDTTLNLKYDSWPLLYIQSASYRAHPIEHILEEHRHHLFTLASGITWRMLSWKICDRFFFLLGALPRSLL